MQQRVNKLRGLFDGAGVEALYITDPENRFYLSGFSGTTGSLMLFRNQSLLLTDFRYIEQARKECPDFTVVQVTGSYSESLPEIVKENGLSVLGCEGDHLTYNQFTQLRESLPGVELKSVSGMVEQLRLCKDELEIECIEEAVRLADEAFLQVLPMIRPGVPERDIALGLEHAMRRMGAEGVAFKIIVASGPRSALPHGVASAKVIRQGELVTMDFGAVYRGYHSDITRTVVMGEPEGKQKEIYAIVLEAQRRALAAVKGGVRAADVDRAAREFIQSRGYGENFGHGTGHGVGLNIHENPKLSSKDTTILKAGMVVTVEPGIYLPGWGGVRIEDTVLVDSLGCRILTQSKKDHLIGLH